MEQEIEQNVVTTSKKNKGIEREREDDLMMIMHVFYSIITPLAMRSTTTHYAAQGLHLTMKASSAVGLASQKSPHTRTTSPAGYL